MIYGAATIYKHRGKWRAQVYWYEGEERHAKTTAISATGKREAQRQADEWRDLLEEEAQASRRYRGSTETVAQYLERYIESRTAFVELSSLSGYRTLLKNQIAPYIGDVLLDDLQPDAVQDWVNALTRSLAPVTVRKAFVLLRSAMTQAVERDRLLKNPTRTVKPPKLPKPKPNALDERGRAILLSVLDTPNLDSPILLGVKMALFTGMREGEICALRWMDVDLNAKALDICQAIGCADGHYYVKEPKTGGSARTIFVPAELAADLSKRRANVERACLAAGRRFLESFYVLGGIDGDFLKPHEISIRWKNLANSLELVGTQGKRPTFHDLRHTFATAAIANGIDVKTVSSALGHSNAAMTLNTYASADPDAKRRAADKMGAIYAAARNANQPKILPMAGSGA